MPQFHWCSASPCRDSHPYVLDWRDPDRPLPRCEIRAPRRHLPNLPAWLFPPPHVATGPADRPFDFCGHVRRLCVSIVAQCAELGHIDVARVLFAVTQARNGRDHGLQARVTPLRFHAGSLTRRHRNREYQVQRIRVNGQEMLYVMTFCLPRFLNQDFDEKLITLFHELYHIGPAFDGDLRRHDGRYAVHTHSKKEYDGQMAQLAREYLTRKVDEALHGFLRLSFGQLHHRHGGIVGVSVPRPKLLPVPPAPLPTQY